MLQSCTGGSSRCARRALVLVFAWGLVMIAALQFRHAENGARPPMSRTSLDKGGRGGSSAVMADTIQEDGDVNVAGLRAVGGGSSRYLLQRFTMDSTSPVSTSLSSSASSSSLSRSPSSSNYDYEAVVDVEPGKSLLDRSDINNNNNKEPLVDKREPRTEEELVREIESRLPSLPLAYWLKTSLELENAVIDGSGNKMKKENVTRSGKIGVDGRWSGKENGSNGNRRRTGTTSTSTSTIKTPTKKNSKAKSNNKGCVPRFPSIFDLEFNNIYWQSLRTSNGTFQLFGAYYDDRKLSRIGPAVRMVGMIDRIEPRVKTYCQMWFEGEREPGIVETLEYKYVWYSKWGNYKQGIYQPYVIACKVPQSHWKRGPPASVSIVERPCDTSTNNLRVIYNKPDVKRGFAVCVKGLDFLHDDLSVRLVEWIELIGLLGADKIYFYQLQVHPNVSKVLDHYTRLGRIEVTPLTLPGGQPNVAAFQHMYLTKKTNNKRQNELIPYNDCLYKHMYEYEYIALLDVDEVIMPLKDSTWPELMKRILPKALSIRNETRASYNVRNVYFLDDLVDSHGSFRHVPRYMHMLQHVYRSKNFTKPNQYVKCFHNPERVVTLHNHFPLACLGAGCTSYPIETEDAQLQHYRADCVKSLKKTCLQYRENSVMDTTIWRYKDRLIERVTDTLEKLGFFPAASSKPLSRRRRRRT